MLYMNGWVEIRLSEMDEEQHNALFDSKLNWQCSLNCEGGKIRLQTIKPVHWYLLYGKILIQTKGYLQLTLCYLGERKIPSPPIKD